MGYYIKPILLGRIVTKQTNGTHQQDRVFSSDGISPSICAGEILGRYLIKTKNNMERIELPKELEGRKFRIRKLTPKECFRLMGVNDANIDKIQAAGVSNSGQYKLAGNSIVVDVLFHIFRKMFIETENENTQLTLF